MFKRFLFFSFCLAATTTLAMAENLKIGFKKANWEYAYSNTTFHSEVHLLQSKINSKENGIIKKSIVLYKKKNSAEAIELLCKENKGIVQGKHCVLKQNFKADNIISYWILIPMKKSKISGAFYKYIVAFNNTPENESKIIIRELEEVFRG